MIPSLIYITKPQNSQIPANKPQISRITQILGTDCGHLMMVGWRCFRILLDMKPNPEGDPQTYSIIGAGMEVHTHLGCGFLEAPYREALEREFVDRQIPYECEVRFQIDYKGRLLRTHYRADFVCYSKVIVEVKSVRLITNIEEAQIINYLKASGLHRALLLNFVSSSLEFRRFLRGSAD